MSRTAHVVHVHLRVMCEGIMRERESERERERARERKTHYTISVVCGRVTILGAYNTPKHAATHCNTLQHTATHCNTLQHTATHKTYLGFGGGSCRSCRRGDSGTKGYINTSYHQRQCRSRYVMSHVWMSYSHI